MLRPFVKHFLEFIIHVLIVIEAYRTK